MDLLLQTPPQGYRRTVPARPQNLGSWCFWYRLTYDGPRVHQCDTSTEESSSSSTISVDVKNLAGLGSAGPGFPGFPGFPATPGTCPESVSTLPFRSPPCRSLCCFESSDTPTQVSDSYTMHRDRSALLHPSHQNEESTTWGRSFLLLHIGCDILLRCWPGSRLAMGVKMSQ